VYDVTYNLDGGTNDSGNPATFVKADLNITLAVATKAANTFDGWFLDAEFTQPITQLTEAKDYTLYAKFTAE
ncbi:MAG: InlB B-repeat-containing protein, partial [Acholeplasma sp.]|nr:InlB B-repeat-containing protein [Acholeplasma sp.]